MGCLYMISHKCFLYFFGICIAGAYAAAVFNVESYGAVGDGMTDDSEAFTKAWIAACRVPSVTMLVPGGKRFLVNNLVFQGPCASGFIFQIDGNVIAPQDPKIWKEKTIWLQFLKLEQFTLQGSGTVDGRGNNWWSCDLTNGKTYCNEENRPTVIQFIGCNRVKIQGLSVFNSPKFHIGFASCSNVELLSIHISAPESSPNTDGIDISGSSDIRIISSNIGTGDDCVAIGSGSTNIYIKDLACGPGHGISVGSLGKGNSEAYVSSVHVDGANITGTKNGLRIKTWQGGSGSASGIVFDKVIMENVANPILIDQYYCDSPKPCANQTSGVKIYNVTYNDISGTSSTPVAVRFACSETVACTDIRMNRIALTMNSGVPAQSFCENAHGEAIGSCNPPSCLAG